VRNVGCFGHVTSHLQAPRSIGQMNSAEERAVPADSGAPTLPNTFTPDGRFFFDGHQWQAAPLPPEVTRHRRRRRSKLLIWVLIGAAAILAGAIISEIIVTIGLVATHELPR
jgi:hypothetical protein